MSKSIKIQIEGKKFKLRVAGIIKENNKFYLLEPMILMSYLYREDI